MRRRRVVLADEYRLVAHGIAKLLPAEFDVTTIVACADKLLTAVSEDDPELVITAVRLPGVDGIEATRRLRATQHRAQVVLLSCYRDVRHVRRGLRAGALGYVLRHDEPAELLHAMREALAGRIYVSPAVAGGVVATRLANGNGQPTADGSILTHRRLQVLKLLAEGHSAKEIATLLDISSRTVDFHRYGIMQQLDLRSFAGLVRYAVRHNIVAP